MGGMTTGDRKALKRIVISRYLMLFPTLAACFFLPAWSLRDWEGWLYMATLGSTWAAIASSRHLVKSTAE
jgi:hypothetical protein